MFVGWVILCGITRRILWGSAMTQIIIGVAIVILMKKIEKSVFFLDIASTKEK